MGRTGADTGLEGRCWAPLEKKPLEGLTEPKGLSACGETDTRVGSLRPRPCPALSLQGPPAHRAAPPGAPPERQPPLSAGLLCRQRRPPWSGGSTGPRNSPPSGRSAPPRGLGLLPSSPQGPPGGGGEDGQAVDTAQNDVPSPSNLPAGLCPGDLTFALPRSDRPRTGRRPLQLRRQTLCDLNTGAQAAPQGPTPGGMRVHLQATVAQGGWGSWQWPGGKGPRPGASEAHCMGDVSPGLLEQGQGLAGTRPEH